MNKLFVCVSCLLVAVILVTAAQINNFADYSLEEKDQHWKEGFEY